MAFMLQSGSEVYFYPDRYIGGDAHLKEWVYITTDPYATVITAGYFTDYAGPRPNAGDLLRIYVVQSRSDLSTVQAVVALVIVDWASSLFSSIGGSFQNSIDIHRDAGAIGDGVVNDTAAFQRAVALAKSTGVRAIALKSSKIYLMDGIDIDDGIMFFCPEDWGYMADESTSLFPFVAAPRVVFRAAATPREMMWWKGPDADDTILGGGFKGVILDGANVATWGARFSSCRYFHGEGFIQRCTTGRLRLDDGNGKLCTAGYFPLLFGAIGSNAACLASKGIEITGDVTVGGGNSSHYFGHVQMEYQTGDPLIFEECDSVRFGFFKANERSASPTGRVRFSAGNTFPARKNRIDTLVRGKVKIEDQTSNSIGFMSGEGALIEKTGTAVLDYKVVDHGSGDFFAQPPYRMSDDLELPIQAGSALSGSPVINAFGGGLIPTIAFDGSGTETWGWSKAPPKDWNDGNIVGYDLVVAHAGAVVSLDTRWQIDLWTRSVAGGIGTAEKTDTQTHRVADAASTWSQLSVTLGTPLAYTRGDMIFAKLSRLGADVLDTLDAVDAQVVTFTLRYSNTGPNYNANTGPFAQVDRYLS